MSRCPTRRSREEYDPQAQAFPNVDFSKLWRYEQEDYTTAARNWRAWAGIAILFC
ncbi:MAG: hypothetical protein R2838_08085 [Caldilineaceae bacterium]